MKRRVLSFTIALALCLELLPVGAFAADLGTGDGLCPHHTEHTDTCGYAPPVLEQECTHSHDDGCFTVEEHCIHEHTAECYPPDPGDGSEAGGPVLCEHTCTQESGCVTRVLSCPHVHDGACGYVKGDPGAPCTFVCPICPIEDLIGKLPGSVSEDNCEQVQAQLDEIYARYDELSADEQRQVDLSPCAALLDQVEGMGAAVMSDAGSGSAPVERYVLDGDMDCRTLYEISNSISIDTDGHTITGLKSNTIRVTGTGELYLIGRGLVTSQNGAGVEVQSGGLLNISGEGMAVEGTTYALIIASGARVTLSAGTYSGTTAAIQTVDGDLSALLAPGCAYFDASGNAVPTAGLAQAKTLVVKQCTSHSKTYDPNAGSPTHSWTCAYCGTTETQEKCEFTFDQSEKGTCSLCGNEIAVEVDRDSLKVLAYDDTVKPANGTVTVTVKDAATALMEDTDYAVSYSTRAEVGSTDITVTVTVTGKTYDGTFTQDYTFTKDELTKPVLEWGGTGVSVRYTGDPVTKDLLPTVTINIQTGSGVDLHDLLQYSYRAAQGSDAYTAGLPTNAGTYDVVVSLSEGTDYQAASSEPITLTVEPIDPIVTLPAPAKPTYDRTAQELVTAGELDPVAIADGLEIQFATEENGTYATTIPTGTDAGDSYRVWYKVIGLTGNYIAPVLNPAEIGGVEILRKPITPVVELEYETCLYDGGFKQPKVTVKDEDHVTILLNTEYQVGYQDNRDVGTALAVVTDRAGGNYDIARVEAPFQITQKPQDTLTITNKPNTIIYGDQFTLETTGGSGSGDVTWEITSGTDVARVDENSGQVTVIGHGSATVKATKSGAAPTRAADGNYEDATASWTFNAVQKPVTAIVTAEDKDYDGNGEAKVHAVVEDGVLAGDQIVITGLTGTFDDENAGTNKTVTVVTTGATITGNNSQHYAITYSSTTVQAAIHKAVVNVTTPPVPANLTYSGTAQTLIGTGAVVGTTGVDVEYALSEDGPYSTDFPKGTDAETYTVWYRVKETNNYTGSAPASVPVTIAKKPVSPTITLDESTFTYDSTAKEPVVTLKEADGTTVIPAGEYTVSYSDNVNVGTATVTVTAKDDGNYSFTPDPVTKDFTISQKQAQVVAAPEPAGRPLFFANYAQRLVTAGTAEGGTMVYSVGDETGYSSDIPERTGAGTYTVYYKVQGDANHSDSAAGHVEVTIAPKVVKDPTIVLKNSDGTPFVSCTYDGTEKKPSVEVKDGSDIIDAGEYEIVYSNNKNAGTATVSITDKLDGNYTVTGSATFVINKADIAFSPAPSAATLIYNGTAQELLVPGTTTGCTVLYALGSETAEYHDYIPTGIDAGTYTVYYKADGDRDHNDLAPQKVEVTIQRKPLTTPTIELTPSSFQYDGKAHLPAVSVKDGDTVLPASEYAWACNVTDPEDSGTYTITVSDKTGGNYDLSVATTNTADFTIGKAAQEELVIEGKPEQVYYGGTFRLTTTGGSGTGAVTWDVVAGGPATVDTNGNVAITGVGEVTITAEKAADTNYAAAQAQLTFTAAPKPVTATVTVDDKDYDGDTTATVASAGITTINSDTVTIDPDSITAAFDDPHAGTDKTVTLDTSNVKVTGDDAAKYAISYPDTVTAAIAKATTTIDPAPAAITSLTYSGQPQALVTAGKTNVGFLVYSLDGTSFSSEIPTGTNAGTYTVYYKVDETSDYTGVAANGTPISVTIDPKSITPKVELSQSSFLYDGTKKEPKITVKDGDTVLREDQDYTATWANEDPSATGELLTAAGSYKATIESVANGNYSFTAAAKVEIKAAVQEALNITGTPEHVYYGDTIATLKATGGSGNGTVTWSITDGNASAQIDTDTGVLTVKGTGPVTVKAERTVPNYAPATGTWTFTVEPKPVVAEVTVKAKDYDGTTAATVTASVKPGDLVNGSDSFTISGLTGVYADANAGTGKPVTLDASTATTTADPAKYTVTYPAMTTGDIGPRQVTVTVTLSGNDLEGNATDGYYYNYDGADKTPTVTVTGTDGSYQATLAASDYDVAYTDNKNVGEATVTVTAKAGGNYTFTGKEVKFTIKSATAALTSSPQAKDLTYEKGTEQELVTVGTATGGTVVYSKTGADGSYSETIPQEENAGTYTVYYMVKGDSNHASTTPKSVSVTIKPKTITPAITLSDTTYTYDGTAKTPTVTVKDGNDEISDTEYSVSYRDNVNAGTATVTVSNKNGGNYIVNGSVTFAITKAAPTVTAPTEKTGLYYNGEAQELVTAGVTSHGTVVYSVDGGNDSPVIPTASAVKTYTISWKVVGDANHSDTTAATLAVTIDKNTVTDPTITLSQDQFTYDGNQHKPTVTVYDKDSRPIPAHEYTVSIAPKTSGNTSNMVDVDTYTVTVTTPATSNYVISGSNTREFKIVPADQETISMTGTKAQVRYGDEIQLGVSGGTGSGTVTWEITGNTDTTLTQGGLLTVKDVNTPIKVTVTRSRDNYGDVSATWEFTAAKKPVTADVTVAPKNYDGTTHVANTAITATVKAADLAFGGDSITITGLTGTYDDPSVGTDKKVTVNSSSPTVTGTNWEKYDITYPATTTASILAVAATVDTAPKAVASLTYDASQAQELVTAGAATGGTMAYSLDGVNFTPNIPKAKNAGTYKVYYKAQGDSDHTDSAIISVDVTIAQQTIAEDKLQIELSPPGAQYDGNVHQPAVTVRDPANNVIPDSEYKATYVTDGGANWKDQGTYTVKVQNITGGNYVVSTKTANFTISTSAQAPLEIVGKPGVVHYGDTFTLSATGGSSSQAVTWSSSNENIAHIDANGLVTIKGVGSATITATKAGGGNYEEATATYPLNALKKPIMATVTADDKVYDGNTDATIHVTWNGLVGNDSIDTTPLSGTFADDKVGTGKTVNITGDPVDNETAKKYDITVQRTTTASILKATATAPNVSAATGLGYTGAAQDLVSGGDANTLYSTSRDGVYSAGVPTGTNAGTYTVWYKAKGDDDHNESEPQSISVTISPKALTADASNVELSGNDLNTETAGDGTTYYYKYDGTDKTPSVIVIDGAAPIPASEYTVTYSNNKNVTTADKKATVTIADNEGGNYTVSGSVTFEIRKGGAQLTGSPQARDLTYTGQPQELVTVGTATGGHLEYRLHSTTDPQPDYSRNIPTATAAGTYTVEYKVVGDGNHEDDTTVGSVTVTIQPKTVTSPKITVDGTYDYTYSGSAKTPTVTIEDGGTDIPDTEYTLSYQNNVNAGTATVIVRDNNGGNYTVNGTATFEIGEATAAVGTAPTGKTGLKYNGTAQELIEAGSASGGTMVYSLTEDGEYSAAIPTGKAVKGYTVWYKVQGDGNHTDSTPQSVTASIAVNEVTSPTIQVTPPSVKYTGEKQTPTVTVRDDDGLLIDGSEYNAVWSGELTAVGTYTVTITETTSGNYTFDITPDADPVTFTITPADQSALTITGTRERVYYGDTIQLDATGGNGDVTWDVGGSTIASINENTGLLTITGVGSVTVTATSTDGNYKPQTATWMLYAEKKQVTAVVTAQDRAYTGDTTATLSVTWKAGDLVGSDHIATTGLTGEFTDANVGANKTVKITGTLTHANYDITVPPATTASIFKADIADADVAAPTPAAGLTYTGLPQPLVTAGSSTQGTLEYSLDGLTYSTSLPTGTSAGDYDVWYRVKGDGNHNDTAGTKLTTDTSKVTIGKQTVDAPTIEFDPTGASYDGQEHRPSVILKDAHGREIPAAEYTVSYGSTNWKDVGDHKVKITAKDGGNYTFDETEGTFTILPAGQSPLSIVGQPGRVQYGGVFTLSTNGGSGTGAVTWESSDGQVAFVNSQTGRVEILKAGGPVTITARKAAGGGYGETTATWTFSAEKKPVTPTVTAKDKVYDATDTAELVVTWKDGDLLGDDSIAFTPALTGKFSNANVGDNKTVTITGTKPSSDKYDVTIPSSTTASITPETATVTGVTAKPDLVYDGRAQELVSSGTATGGTVEYSLDGSSFSPNIPKAADAGSYTVWYKAVADDSNHADSARKSVLVTIEPKTVTPTIELSPTTFDYDGTAKKPDVVVKDGNTVISPSEYTVSYSNNIAVSATATATVTVTDVAGGNYTVNGSAAFTIKAGTVALKEAPKANNLTYNGFEQELVTEGTAVNGQVVYAEAREGSYSTSIPMKADAGTYQVWYKVQGANGAADTTPKQLLVTIRQKEVTPVIRIGGRSSYSVAYNGSAQEPDITVYVESKEYSDLYYTVEYDGNDGVGTAEVTVTSTGGNYQFLAFKTFTITKGKAAFMSGGEPAAKAGLVYTGEPQDLVGEGIAEDVDSIVVYSLDRTNYSPVIPTGINRGSYTVYAKVQGNEFYEDSAVVVCRVTIDVNALTADQLIVSLSANSFPYTGSEVKPTVTVTQKMGGNVISADEYTVTYSNNVAMGTATVSIQSKTNGNYSFTATTQFQIVDASQPVLTITGKPDRVRYGDTIATLRAEGASGAVAWSMTGGTRSTIDQATGRLVVKDGGAITVTASSGSLSDAWTFTVEPKPVTAVVTAASKPYDGNNTATLTVTISSGLVPGDSITTNTDDGVKATGHFVDASVEENKTVVIDGLTIPAEVSAKYDISWPSTTKASITPKAANVTEAPKAVTGPLTYNGGAQALLASGGTAEGGELMYSLDGKDYGYTIPTGTDAGTYTVWYKVAAGDENHKDSAAVKLGPVTIDPYTGPLSVLCTPDQFRYDGTAKAPTVVVRDNAQRILPDSEYTVTLPAGRIAVDTYTVTVTDRSGGNYQFDAPVTGTFNIVASSQDPLSIITDIPTNVHYGDTFRLSAMGGSGGGAIHWSIKENNSAAEIDDNGVVTVTGTGGFTVEAYREASDGYDRSNTASVPFVAKPKSVTPMVTVKPKSYDGTANIASDAITVTVRPSDLVSGDSITINVLRAFYDSANAGTGKTVTLDLTSVTVSGRNADRYVINWPDSVTGTIDRVNAKLATAPAGADLTYDGSAQPLVIGGSTAGNIGKVEYSASQNGAYSETIPTGTNAGRYKVWYRVEDSVNYMGIPATEIEVEIKKATPTINTKPTASGTAGQALSGIRLEGGATNTSGGTFAWAEPETKAVAGTAYTVIFTPEDDANYEPVTFTLTPVSALSNAANGGGSTGGGTGTDSTSSTGSGSSMRTTVQNGTANTVLSATGGDQLVKEAVKSQSDTIVIKPEIASDVTKAQVSIPASTVSQINSQTDAALTVASPIADVTIPNGALSTLSRAGGTVNVVTEQVGGAVALTLTADGKTVEDVPGGVTLTVPAEDAGAGTVAVLVHDDGSREVLQRSVVKDGKLSAPLSGSATVEIVDNGKSFDDVPDTNWAAEAVTFASARELFNGTSETTFSPNETTSRGMVATVLYRLEGQPDQALTDVYDDVSGDAWYADSVAWAAENGIVNGYGDGQFGPDDSVTREQFVVMLWRYLGSPEANSHDLAAFTDADQIDSYAREALCWAVENGVLNGNGGGQLVPGGTATRAEAAQMLKNFIENT